MPDRLGGEGGSLTLLQVDGDLPRSRITAFLPIDCRRTSQSYSRDGFRAGRRYKPLPRLDGLGLMVEAGAAGPSELALVGEGDNVAVEYPEVNDLAGGLVGAR